MNPAMWEMMWFCLITAGGFLAIAHGIKALFN